MTTPAETPAPSSAADQAVQEAGAALARDADRIALHVANLLTAEVPETSPDPVSLEETRRSCRATLLTLLGAWRRGESLDQVDPPRELLFQIEVLARDGVPLRPFTRMCRLAHGALVDAWDAELTAAPLPRDVQLAAIRTAHQLTFQWFDTLVERLTGVYEAELERLARTPDTIRRAVVQSALTGKSVDADALSRAAGYELRRHHIGVVLWHDAPHPDAVPEAGDAQPTFQAIIRAAAQRVGAGPPLIVSAGNSTAWAWVGGREPINPSSLRAALAAERRGAVAIAIGEPGAGLSGFRHTHEDALSATRVAMLAPGDRRVVAFESVELAALLASDLPRARRLVHRRLGGLARDDADHARLRETLKVHLEEDGNRAAAADRLGVHANTISNRVRACEALLPAGTVAHSVETRVALLLAETLGPPVLARRATD